MEERISKSDTYAKVTEECGYQWDHRQHCEARRILDRVADRWSLPVMQRIAARKMRFSELHRDLPGISHRMLTSTLRQLERDGIVERTVFPVVPPRVDYALTPLGETLYDTLLKLADWSENNATAIAESRKRFDAQAADGAEP
jgi:DNA-binding HxlR family transcriptional regulator